MNKDFLPAFKEETALVASTSAPGTSLEQMNQLADAIEEQILLAADQPGKEILSPVAIVIVGGLASSTLLDSLVTPLIFFHFAKTPARRALNRRAAATR